jgi:hypothetical protein
MKFFSTTTFILLSVAFSLSVSARVKKVGFKRAITPVYSLEEYWEHLKMKSQFSNLPRDYTFAKERVKYGDFTPTEFSSRDELLVNEKAFNKTDIAKFKKRFMQATTPDKLDELLLELENEYKQIEAGQPNSSGLIQSNAMKFIAAQVIPLRKLRGVLWRMIPLMGNTKIAHTMAVSQLQRLAGSIQTFYPYKQWNTLFDYLTQPYLINKSTGTIVPFFNHEADIQAFFANDVYTAIYTAARRIREKELDLSKGFIWDKSISYGEKFKKGYINRFRIVGSTEQAATLSRYHFQLSFLASQRAYSSFQKFKVMKELGQLHGVEAITSSLAFMTAKGISANKRIEVLKGYSGKTDIRLEDGKKWMALSYKHIKEGVYQMAASWELAKNRGQKFSNKGLFPLHDFMFDPSIFLNNQDINEKVISKMVEMVENKKGTQLLSAATGEHVKVNLYAYFHNPPNNIIEELYPIEFVPDQKKFADWRILSRLKESYVQSLRFKPIVLKSGEHEVKTYYRNYLAGSPKKWNESAWREYLPTLSKEKDVRTHARIIHQSLGGGLAAVTMLKYLR